MGGHIMGILNIFNDLLNVDIEGDLAKLAVEELGIEGGRHGASESNPDKLMLLDLPEPEISLEDALAARSERGSDWQNLARQALGYERINLLSESYGTRLAQIYMWMHPESLQRVVMISVNPPGNMVWEPDYVDRLIEHDAALCAQDPRCSSRTEDMAETMSNVAHNIPDRWLFFPIDPGMLRAISFLQLFHRGSAALIYDAFLAAEAGDPSGLALGS